MTKAADIDDHDVRILNALSEDGRISWRDLSDRIGLSLTPTLRRVRRLEEIGIIKGYSARLDRDRLVGAMTVFITVTMERQIDDVLRAFEAKIGAQTEIVSAFLVTGVSDYLIHAAVRDLEHYRDLLAELTRIPGVAHIQSSFALKAITPLETGSLRPLHVPEPRALDEGE